MFKKIPAPLKSEYKGYFRSHKLLFGFHVLLMFLLTVIPPFEFWSGIRAVDNIGGLIFETLEEADHPLSYAALFFTLIVLERVFRYVYKLVRVRELVESLHYIEGRVYSLPVNDVTDRASACKNSFGDCLDYKIGIIESVLLALTLSAVCCYTNYFAGGPFIVLCVINTVRTAKGKPKNKWLTLASNFLLQAYLLSTIILMVLRVLSYGSLLGFYCAIYVRLLMEKHIAEDIIVYKMQSSRLAPLSEAFAGRTAAVVSETPETDQAPANDRATADGENETDTAGTAAEGENEPEEPAVTPEEQPETASSGE